MMLSITLIVPFDSVVRHRLLDNCVREGVVASAEALRIAINEQGLFNLVNIYSSTPQTVSLPLAT